MDNFEEAHTVGDFFVRTVKPRLSRECGDATQCFVGPDKNSLYHVSDNNLSVVLVVQSFGRFLMYHVAVDLSTLASDQEFDASGSGRGQSCPPAPCGGIPLNTICIQEKNKTSCSMLSLGFCLTRVFFLMTRVKANQSSNLWVWLEIFCGMLMVTTMFSVSEPLVFQLFFQFYSVQYTSSLKAPEETDVQHIS